MKVDRTRTTSSTCFICFDIWVRNIRSSLGAFSVNHRLHEDNNNQHQKSFTFYDLRGANCMWKRNPICGFCSGLKSKEKNEERQCFVVVVVVFQRRMLWENLYWFKREWLKSTNTTKIIAVSQCNAFWVISIGTCSVSCHNKTGDKAKDVTRFQNTLPLFSIWIKSTLFLMFSFIVYVLFQRSRKEGNMQLNKMHFFKLLLWCLKSCKSENNSVLCFGLPVSAMQQPN